MSGFGGSLLSALFIQYGISVGASGALFGFLGSMLSELISNWTMYVNKWDNFARIKGFVSGFLLGFLFLIRPQFKWLTQRNAPPGRVTTPVKSKHKTYQYVLWVLSLILLIVGSADFGSTLRTAQNELENEPYMLGKLRMSIFWSILQIINIIFLEEVMTVLTLKGSQEIEQFVTAMNALNPRQN